MIERNINFIQNVRILGVRPFFEATEKNKKQLTTKHRLTVV